MPNPSNESKKSGVLDSFFKGRPKPPAPRTPSKAETLPPAYPDARHEEAHFETLDDPGIPLPKPSFLTLAEPSEAAKAWHIKRFSPHKPKNPKPEELRALIKRLLEGDDWHYFLEHLGDFSSEENRLLRSLLKDKFDLSMLLNEVNAERWEGFLDVVKFQPWFRERLIRNGIDLESLMLDFPDSPMKILRAFKEDFIKACTQDLNELNAVMNQLNAKERDDLLFEIIGINKLCDNIKNATQLGRFLKILNEDEFDKFLKLVDKKWIEGVTGSTNGIAVVLELLKKTAGDSFDRQKKFLDAMGGLKWLKDTLLFDRYRNIYGVSALARGLSKEQLFDLLVRKLGLANMPYVTVDFGTMLIVLHGVPAGMQADLALALIRENINFGITIIENATDLIKLLKTLSPPENQIKFFTEITQNPGKYWLRTLTTTLKEITEALPSLSPKLQQEIVQTLFKTEDILNQVNTIEDRASFLALWKALPKDFPYSALLENTDSEKLSDFLSLHEVPTSLWSKISKLEDFISMTEALPKNLQTEFLLAPETIKTLKELIGKIKQEAKASSRETGKSIFSSKAEPVVEASIKAVLKLLTKDSDKQKLHEALTEKHSPQLKSWHSK